MKIWVDDIRPASKGYTWYKECGEVITYLSHYFSLIEHGFYPKPIEILSLDHDAGYYSELSGDYIEILNWLEKKQYNNNIVINFPIHLHTMNPVGKQNMRTIIQHNNWKEIMYLL